MIVVLFALLLAGYKGYKEIKRKQQTSPFRRNRRHYHHFHDGEYDSEISSDEADDDIGWTDNSANLSLIA